MSFTQLENHSQLLCGHNFANERLLGLSIWRLELIISKSKQNYLKLRDLAPFIWNCFLELLLMENFIVVNSDIIQRLVYLSPARAACDPLLPTDKQVPSLFYILGQSASNLLLKFINCIHDTIWSATFRIYANNWKTGVIVIFQSRCFWNSINHTVFLSVCHFKHFKYLLLLTK